MSASTRVFTADPPTGVERDPTQHHRATNLIVVNAIFGPLVVILVLLRCYTKAVILRAFGWDDVIMIVAMVAAVILAVFLCNMINYGLGKDIWNTYRDQVYPHFLVNYLIASIGYCVGTSLSKIPILMLFLRLFPGKKFKWTCYVLIFVCAAYGLTSTLLNVFLCNPVKGYWDYEAALTAKCINRGPLFMAVTGTGALVDICTLILPFPHLIKLQMPRKQKLAVAMLFFSGVFVCIVSLYRLVTVKNLAASTNSTSLVAPLMLWATLEVDIIIIAGCIPILKPLAKKYIPSLLGKTSGNDYGFSHESAAGKGQPAGLSSNLGRAYGGNGFAMKTYNNGTVDAFDTRKGGDCKVYITGGKTPRGDEDLEEYSLSNETLDPDRPHSKEDGITVKTDYDFEEETHLVHKK